MKSESHYAHYVRPATGESLSGDAAFTVESGDRILLALVDAAGHGPKANKTANAIVERLKLVEEIEPVTILAELHATASGTRGAAVGLCLVDTRTGVVRFVGVGNVVFRRFGSMEQRLISQEGLLGTRMRTPVEQRLMVEARDLILMHSDGVPSRFHASDYSELHTDSPWRVCRTIVQRFGKGHDDASCIAYRHTP